MKIKTKIDIGHENEEEKADEKTNITGGTKRGSTYSIAIGSLWLVGQAPAVGQESQKL